MLPPLSKAEVFLKGKVRKGNLSVLAVQMCTYILYAYVFNVINSTPFPILDISMYQEIK